MQLTNRVLKDFEENNTRLFRENGTQELFLNVNKTLSSYDDGNKNDNREELVDDSGSDMVVAYIEISYEY